MSRHATLGGLLLLSFGGLTGCSVLPYYGQALLGELEVLAKRRPIQAVLEDPAVPAQTRRRLERFIALKGFAVGELGLPDRGSYRDYSELGRRFVLWNVFATEELSLRLLPSCFPLLGCLSYRGFFREEAARRHARALALQGYDVYVGGVAAYSTLGWFCDPVLDTMLPWGEVQMARFLFHELAHQRLYVPGDTAFNEGFAEAVADEGLRRWVERLPDPALRERYRREVAREREFLDLVLEAKAQLESAYRAEGPPEQKRRRKAAILAALRQRYAALRSSPAGDGPTYDEWMDSGLNNAKIAAVAAYREHVVAFEAMLAAAGGEMDRFFAISASVAALPAGHRAQCLEALRTRGKAGLKDCH